MLYLEDFLECVEHLPHDLRDRFTEMRELDLTVQNNLDRLESEQETFFAECKENKDKESRDNRFDQLKAEYGKSLEEADDKVQLGNHIYDLVDRYVRRLDQELQKYKMELEADNAGITDQLEQKCLKEMNSHPQLALNSHKSDRRKEGSRKKVRGGIGGGGIGVGSAAALTAAAGGGESSSAIASGSSLIPTVVSRLDGGSSRASSPNLPSSDSTEPSGSRPSSRNPVFPSLSAGASQSLSALVSGGTIGAGLDHRDGGEAGISGASASSVLPEATPSNAHSDKAATSNSNSTKQNSNAAPSSSSSQLNYNAFTGMSNPTLASAASSSARSIAAAASQAIAATTHMQQGRRTSSLKASYEALRTAGELAKELTFGDATRTEGGSGAVVGNAYGPNPFVTDGLGASSSTSASTKTNKHKKARPNNSSSSQQQQQQQQPLLAAGNSGVLDGSSFAFSSFQLESPLNPNGGVSSSSSSSQLTGQSGSQGSFSSGLDESFGSTAGGAVGGLIGIDAGGGGVPVGGEGEFQAVDGGDWAYDPNEPRYCICNQVSYGEMVGCDNGDCPIEWFHYGCVALTQAPKGKWYCPQCTAAMKRRNRR